MNKMGAWTDKQVEDVMKNENATRAEKIAAYRVISNEAMDFDRIMDRTEGKPNQSHKVEHSGEIPVKVIVQKSK